VFLSSFRKQSKENTRADWLKTRWKHSTELARACGVMMVRAKRIYTLIIKFNKLLSFFSSLKFERTRKSCGNTRLRLKFPQHFLVPQTSTRVSIKQLDFVIPPNSNTFSNALGRTKLSNALGQQYPELWTCPWSGRATWNRGKFVCQSAIEVGQRFIYLHLHLPIYKHALSTRLMCSGRSAFLQDVIVQCSMYIPQSW